MNKLLDSPRGVNLSMAAAMLAVGVANILWAEQLTVNRGFGWDGLWYSAWARDFYQHIFVERIPDYYVQRILPSGVVHYGMRLFGVARTDPNIILAFQVYNLALLMMSAYVWGLVADRLGLGTKGKWLGFVFLFLNYAVLKNNFYHAVLTDTTAFALGVLMFYFFLRDSRAGLIFILLAGGFVWPTLPHMAGLLFIFPRPREAGARPEPPEAPALFGVRLNTLAAALAAAGVVAALLYLTARGLEERMAYFGRTMRIDFPLIPLSIAAVGLYLFFAVRAAAGDGRLYRPAALLKGLNWRRAAVVVLLMAVPKVAVRLLGNGVDFGWGSLKGFLMYTLMTTLADPLLFFVAHVVYFGPAVLLLAFLWRPFCEAARGFGLGMTLFLLFNVGMSINPQSRYQINAVPALMMILAWMLDRRGLTWRAVALWAALGVASSKVWYVFRIPADADDGTMEALLRFPLQHYFMSSGPWMSREMYFAQGAAVLLGAVVVFLVVWRQRLRAAAGVSDRPPARAGAA